MSTTPPSTFLHDLSPMAEIAKTSYSGLTKHRTCPQAWAYRTVWQLRRPPSTDAKVEARFGLMWHALRAADSIDRGRDLDSLKSCPDSLKIGDDCERIPTDTEDPRAAVLDAVRAFEEGLSEEWKALWQEKLNGQPLALLVNLDHRYRKQWVRERMNEAPIGVEVGWGRPLSDTTRLVGYSDEIYLDIERNVVVVRDHKTAKGLGVMSAAQDLQESQLHLNVWGLKHRIEEWEGSQPSAVSYDRVCSLPPSKPKLLKNGTLSKQTTRWDLDTYLTFCNSEECKAAGYTPEPAVVERLSTPAAATAWFQRTLVPVNRNVARAHLQAALDTLEDSRRTVARVLARGEGPRNMTGDACKWCEFSALCRAQMVGGPRGEYDVSDYGLESSAPPLEVTTEVETEQAFDLW